jgi:uncharacterized membrane protein
MALLIAATVLVIASHVVPSAPGLRARLIGTFGRSGFYAGYSLASILTLGLLIWAYRAAGPQDWLYTPAPAARIVAVVAMLLATFLVTTRLTTRASPDRPIGIYRVTAVPGSLGVLIWALVHLLNLGEARAVVVFAGLAVMTLIAMVKNLALAGSGVSRRRLAAVRRDRGRTRDLRRAGDRLVAGRPRAAALREPFVPAPDHHRARPARWHPIASAGSGSDARSERAVCLVQDQLGDQRIGPDRAGIDGALAGRRQERRNVLLAMLAGIDEHADGDAMRHAERTQRLRDAGGLVEKAGHHLSEDFPGGDLRRVPPRRGAGIRMALGAVPDDQ